MRLRPLCAGLALLVTLSLAGCCHSCKTSAQRPVIVGSAPVACPSPCPCPGGGAAVPAGPTPAYAPPP